MRKLTTRGKTKRLFSRESKASRDSRRAASPHVQNAFGKLAHVHRFDQTEGLFEKPRFDPIVFFTHGQKLLTAPSINFKPDGIQAGIDQPVFGYAGAPIGFVQNAHVLLDRTLTDDFQDHVGRTDQFRVPTGRPFDEPNPIVENALIEDEDSVGNVRNVGVGIGKEDAVGQIEPRSAFLGKSIQNFREFSFDLHVRKDLFSGHVDPHFSLNPSESRKVGKIGRPGPTTKCIDVFYSIRDCEFERFGSENHTEDSMSTLTTLKQV